MPTNHVVQQGEHLSRIAKVYGFSDYRTIWNDAQNADLKAKRKNPNVLFPGDRLVIPDRHERQESKATDKRHKFRVHQPTLKLRLVVHDHFQNPVANAPCTLSIDSTVYQLTTDAKGKIEQVIPADAETAMLLVRDPQTQLETIQVPIDIGHLDPVEEVSGQRGRLVNLGYLTGDITQVEPEDFESAVQEFQCDNGLTVDGRCGPGTQAKLKEIHGC